MSALYVARRARMPSITAYYFVYMLFITPISPYAAADAAFDIIDTLYADAACFAYALRHCRCYASSRRYVATLMLDDAAMPRRSCYAFSCQLRYAFSRHAAAMPPMRADYALRHAAA